MNTAWQVLTRKKVLDPVSTEQSELGRVLNTWDLTALGVGSTLGVGVYVLAGHVAKDTAGPAVVLSFLIAAVASLFAGLCYAEFGARTPRAGSAYIYSYVCVGEFIAFVIGWNLILEYVIGSASVARGLSSYLDTLLNNTLRDTFIDIVPIHGVSFMSEYFDLFAFGISILLAIALAFGMKESSKVNNVVTVLNLGVVAIAVIAGATKADPKNWNLSKPANSTEGSGGFFPFGVEGMIKGASTCFYGFVGFDCIATTGEEVRNPKRAIPIAIISSLIVIFLAYFSTSTVVTLMLPYYDQDPNAPIPHAFDKFDMTWAKWTVAIGAIFGLCASLFGAMFPLPRIIYAMASDNLIFRFLGKVSARFKTPVIGTLLAGILTGLMAALFDLRQLVDMMSIGTLMAYTIVAASVLLLRYEVEKGNFCEMVEAVSDSDDTDYTDNRGLDGEDIGLISSNEQSTHVLTQIFNFRRQDAPTEVSSKIVKFQVCLYCVLCLLIGLCAKYLKTPIGDGKIWAIVLTAVVIGITVFVLASITTQPQSHKELSFKVPLVPVIPALSILVNIYLMLMLDMNTWIRFAVWMAIGLPTYYFSVQIKSDARNESISSRDVTPNEKTNGFVKHDIAPNNIITDEGVYDLPTPSTINNKIESTIAELDEVLENYIDRKYSVDSLSTASNVLREENVLADVHCADVPSTPVLVDTDPIPLLQTSAPDMENPPEIEPVVMPHEENVTPLPLSSVHIYRQHDIVATPLPSDNDTPPKEVATSSIPSITPLQNVNDACTELNEADAALTESRDTLPKPPSPPPIPITEPHQVKSEPIRKYRAPPPPSPPPQVDVLDNPRLQLRDSALAGVKLKPLEKPPETSPADYSRQNSQLPPEESNLKFGSPEHREFLEKLNATLQEGYYVPPNVIIANLTKPSSRNQRYSSPNEDVYDDNIDQEDAKLKLAEFLARTNSLNSRPTSNKVDSEENKKTDFKEDKDDSEENKKTDFKEDKDDKEEHRRNMQNIFGSIQLRKKDNQDVPDAEETKPIIIPKEENKKTLNNDTINNDRLNHKENMATIFRSIRLRKEDKESQ